MIPRCWNAFSTACLGFASIVPMTLMRARPRFACALRRFWRTNGRKATYGGLSGRRSLRVAVAWIAKRVITAPPSSYKASHVAYFTQRMQMIAQRVAERVAAPLLSAPTHAGAWIDPRVLIGRLEIWAKLPVMPDSFDLSLALLRLAPDQGAREQALDLAMKLKGPHAAAVRYALGGDAKEIGPEACVWIAAARTRAPFEDDPRVEARHPGLGPDAGRAAQFDLLPGRQGFVDSDRAILQPIIARTPTLPETVRIDLPTVLLHVP